MNERDMRMMYDGRRLPPRNARGEFMSRGRGRGRRGDRGMHYPEMHGDGRVIRSYPRMDYAGDMNYDMARSGRQGGRGDYGYDMARGGDMRSMDYRGDDYRGEQMMGDGHHYPEHQMGGQTYYPIEAMGRFNGYWGMPQGDYGYGRKDYGYDYGYDYGDYGETLSEKELEHWNKKLMSQLDEREKQMFSKEAVIQRAKAMGAKMEGFGENELYTTCLMIFSDYKRSIGANLDLTIKLALDWLQDQDTAVKGAEKLAIYHDEVVMGGEDD